MKRPVLVRVVEAADPQRAITDFNKKGNDLARREAEATLASPLIPKKTKAKERPSQAELFPEERQAELFERYAALPPISNVEVELTAEMVARALPGAKIEERGFEGGRWYLATMPNGHQIGVRQLANLPLTREAILRGYGREPRPGDVAVGSHVRVGLGSLIRLAKLGGDETVLRHEVFHAASAAVLTDVERKALYARYGGEEGAAAAYESWDGRKAPNTWFGKIRLAFRRLFARLLNRPEAIFGRIHDGEVWRRAVRAIEEGPAAAVRGRETGPHGPVFREFHHDAKGAIEKLLQEKAGQAVAALFHPAIGDFGLIWGKPGATPRKGFGLAKIVKWHAREGVLEDLQGLISSMHVVPEKSNDNTYQLENDTHVVVVRRNWHKVETEPWLLTGYFDKAKAAAPSAGRTIDIPGTREEDWPSPPPGDAATSTIGTQEAFVKSPEYEKAAARALELVRAGLTQYRPWAERMRTEYGRRIEPHLFRLWAEARPLWDDEAGHLRLEKVAAWTRQRAESAWGGVMQFPAALAMPAGWRVRREAGGRGRVAMDLVHRAGEEGELIAGHLVARLMDARITHLDRAERFNLLDVLEGRAEPVSERVRAAAAAARQVTDEIAARAEGLGVKVRNSDGERVPFVRRPNYFPHVLRNAGALASGPVRRDVIENLVRLGERPDKASAEEFLDEWVSFLKGGDRVDQILKHMVKTNQAADEAAALKKLQEHRGATRRHGSLEYAREVDLPFYDPDPARVLPWWAASSGKRLAGIAFLGQDSERLNKEVLLIARAAGRESADFMRQQLDRMLGRAMEPDHVVARMSRIVRTAMIFKLGLAQIPNATQTLNVLLRADFPALAAGIRWALTKRGRRFALASGATLDPVLAEAGQDIGGWDEGGGRLARGAERFLEMTGFTATERMNRVIAANAGVNFARRSFAKLQRMDAKKRAKHWRYAKLQLLGIDAGAALKRGALTNDELRMAAKRMSDITQFRTRPQDMPTTAHGPLGKIAWQFKTFAYNQARMVAEETIGELRAGHYGRATRALFILAALYPLAGDLVRQLRDLLRGKERDYEGLLDRYTDAILEVGGLGIVADMFERAGWGKLAEFLIGPAPSTAVEAGEILASKRSVGDKAKAEGKLLLRQLPFGSVARQWFD